MGIKATKTKRMPSVEPGMYVARCYSMIHFGTTYDERWDKTRNEVNITWELPLELKIFNEDKGEQPVVVSNNYTLSMHEKANLRIMLESWRGKGFTSDEVDEFDITKLMGVPCMLNLTWYVSEKNGNTYINISSVNPLPKGTKCPKQNNSTLLFDFEENFVENVDELFPEWIAEKIKDSDEYNSLIKKTMTGDEETTDDKGKDKKGYDLPF